MQLADGSATSVWTCGACQFGPLSWAPKVCGARCAEKQQPGVICWPARYGLPKLEMFFSLEKTI